jgi:hypothetical protein
MEEKIRGGIPVSFPSASPEIHPKDYPWRGCKIESLIGLGSMKVSNGLALKRDWKITLAVQARALGDSRLLPERMTSDSSMANKALPKPRHKIVSRDRAMVVTYGNSSRVADMLCIS